MQNFPFWQAGEAGTSEGSKEKLPQALQGPCMPCTRDPNPFTLPPPAGWRRVG